MYKKTYLISIRTCIGKMLGSPPPTNRMFFYCLFCCKAKQTKSQKAHKETNFYRTAEHSDFMKQERKMF